MLQTFQGRIISISFQWRWTYPLANYWKNLNCNFHISINNSWKLSLQVSNPNSSGSESNSKSKIQDSIIQDFKIINHPDVLPKTTLHRVSVSRNFTSHNNFVRIYDGRNQVNNLWRTFFWSNPPWELYKKLSQENINAEFSLQPFYGTPVNGCLFLLGLHFSNSRIANLVTLWHLSVFYKLYDTFVPNVPFLYLLPNRKP